MIGMSTCKKLDKQNQQACSQQHVSPSLQFVLPGVPTVQVQYPALPVNMDTI